MFHVKRGLAPSCVGCTGTRQKSGASASPPRLAGLVSTPGDPRRSARSNHAARRRARRHLSVAKGIRPTRTGRSLSIVDPMHERCRTWARDICDEASEASPRQPKLRHPNCGSLGYKVGTAQHQLAQAQRAGLDRRSPPRRDAAAACTMLHVKRSNPTQCRLGGPSCRRSRASTSMGCRGRRGLPAGSAPNESGDGPYRADARRGRRIPGRAHGATTMRCGGSGPDVSRETGPPAPHVRRSKAPWRRRQAIRIQRAGDPAVGTVPLHAIGDMWARRLFAGTSLAAGRFRTVRRAGSFGRTVAAGRRTDRPRCSVRQATDAGPRS